MVAAQGWDKTYCLQFVREDYDEIHFFGDKTFKVEGGVGVAWGGGSTGAAGSCIKPSAGRGSGLVQRLRRLWWYPASERS